MKKKEKESMCDEWRKLLNRAYEGREIELDIQDGSKIRFNREVVEEMKECLKSLVDDIATGDIPYLYEALSPLAELGPRDFMLLQGKIGREATGELKWFGEGIYCWHDDEPVTHNKDLS